MTTVSSERLAAIFVEVADTLVDDFDLIEFLQMLTDRAADLVSAASVGLALADQCGRLEFMAGSDENVRLVELFQLQARQGPCLEAFRTGKPVINLDLGAATARWPRFAPRAAAAGFQSVHAFPLRVRSQVIGAMNVFGDTHTTPQTAPGGAPADTDGDQFVPPWQQPGPALPFDPSTTIEQLISVLDSHDDDAYVDLIADIGSRGMTALAAVIVTWASHVYCVESGSELRSAGRHGSGPDHRFRHPRHRRSRHQGPVEMLDAGQPRRRTLTALVLAGRGACR